MSQNFPNVNKSMNKTPNNPCHPLGILHFPGMTPGKQVTKCRVKEINNVDVTEINPTSPQKIATFRFLFHISGRLNQKNTKNNRSNQEYTELWVQWIDKKESTNPTMSNKRRIDG